MKEYTVRWEIQVDATSPLEAARAARACQEPGTEALMFEVLKGGESNGVFIDLEDGYDEDE